MDLGFSVRVRVFWVRVEIDLHFQCGIYYFELRSFFFSFSFLYFSPHGDFLQKLVKSVKEVEAIILSEVRTGQRSSSSLLNQEHLRPSRPCYEQRLKQFDERFCFDLPVTQIFIVLGMAGIGKTTLAKRHFDKCKNMLSVNKIFLGIRERSRNELRPDWLIRELLEDHANIFLRKSYVFLDDVSELTPEIKFLLRWVKEGSKIVITTRDKSWIKGLVHDTYLVPGLNDNEALQLFLYHAFNNQDYTPPTDSFIKLSQKSVDFAGGNPRALEELGKELCGLNEDEWERRLEMLPHCCNDNIKREIKISYDMLTDQQKDAFLDIACFFISEDEDHVTSLLASKDESCEVRDLADKFMLSVSSGKIEMPPILSSLGRELSLFASLEDNLGKIRLCDRDKVIEALTTNEVRIIHDIRLSRWELVKLINL